MLNSINDLNIFLKDKKFKKIFILCGKNSYSSSGAENLLSKELINKECKFYFKLSKIPIIQELVEIIKSIRSFNPDLILAIGGGSVIDYAKTANVITIRSDLKELIKNYSFPFRKKFKKLAVIPTTAGSGAEVTSNAVIYIDNIKYSFESNLLLPDYFFLIPEFIISSSKNIKASSGFDAIAQALESLISRKSTEKSVIYATKSLKVSLNSYISLLENPNIKNSSEMLIASNFAGKAINISKTTSPHAVSYPFTSLFDISHGHAVSLFFEDFFRFNFSHIKKSELPFSLEKRFDLIFDLLNVKNIEGFSSKIKILKKKAKLEDNLKKLKINIKERSNEILKGINPLRLGNNPIPINNKDIYNILMKIN